MRTSTNLGVFVFILALASPAVAQTSVGFGGANPSAIVNQPITSTSGSSGGIPLFDHSIHLKEFMPNVSTFSNRPVIGQSTFPTGDNMPGLNYLKAFGFSQSTAQTSAKATNTKKKRRFPIWLYARPYAPN